MQTIELDPRDKLLQEHVPAVMVPKFHGMPDLAENGHRYLVARDGLWLEVRRPWLHLRWPIAPTPAPTPYGELRDKMDFAFNMNGIEFQCHMREFEDAARKAFPNECAAWFIWNSETRSLAFRNLVATNATATGVRFHRPALADNEHLAVDLHSHGAIDPYFSSTDDEDDAGEVKLCIVLGNVRTPREDRKIRLCAHSVFINFEKAAK